MTRRAKRAERTEWRRRIRNSLLLARAHERQARGLRIHAQTYQAMLDAADAATALAAPPLRSTGPTAALERLLTDAGAEIVEVKP